MMESNSESDSELIPMEIKEAALDDIDDKTTILVIKIPNSKTNIERTFVVLGDTNVALYRKYLSLRPQNTPHRRFFLQYRQGKCKIQPVGVHTFGNIASKIAVFLKLPQPKEYTGHCLRRTSATLFVDGGGNLTNLKRHGGWKSTTVAEGYIENSLRNKVEIAQIIQKGGGGAGGENQIEIQRASTSASSSASDITTSVVTIPYNINITNCQNCTININKQ